MSFAAEPYGVFVDDLVSSLTGGITRERFVFVEDQAPFRLAHGADFVPGTVRIHGLVAGEFFRFGDGVDFDVDADGTIVWRAAEPSLPAPGATWPDRGSDFYASYERRPDPQAPPLLTDRNPGSVLRTLAESFAREFAVLSRQLELVYDSAFLETAQGRDLEQVVSLVGIDRRTRMFAAGEVVFSRSTPAPADIFIPEGTLVSTAEAPAVTVATTEPRTVRAGTLSVAAPVRSGVEGPAGAAAAGTLSVIHRPILGIESAVNPQPITFGGGSETDESLRRRAARALETGGRATVGSLIGALASVEAIREQDVRVDEDHLAFPGVVKIAVASELDAAAAARAAALIEEHRPAGIRVLHNLPVVPPVAVSPGFDSGGEEGGPPQPAGLVEDLWFFVGVSAAVTPASSSLTAAQKSTLVAAVEQVVRTYVETRGVGETIVYNQLVASIVTIDGVYDVSLDVYPSETAPHGRRNLVPAPPDTRPQVRELDVTIRGAPIALDVSVVVERRGLSAGRDAASALENARTDILRRLAEGLRTLAAPVNQANLAGILPDTEDYSVSAISYTAEFVDEGLRITSANREIVPAPDQQPWIRSVVVTEEVLTS
jgi:uncharacterized phage protein gp47/JayE